MVIQSPPPLGIAAIAVHQPSMVIENDWFGDTMPRKFAHHTGIEARGISLDDEVTMGVDVVRRLQADVGCDLADCRGILFASPSLIPSEVARRYLDPVAASRERPAFAARQLVTRLGIPRCHAVGVNWFCCGYSRAFDLVANRWAPRLSLRGDEYVIIVASTRISRITDYGCRQTAGLFGDMATATLVAPVASRRYPAHFEILHAAAQRQTIDRPAFDFHVGNDVPVPTADGGRRAIRQRLVYSLDGMAIAEIAPRAMSAAVVDSLLSAGLSADDVGYVVPHQAGAGIVRFTGMKLDEYGIRGELVSGLTRRTGNVSACSIPHALAASWSRLRGIVACPTAAVGSPGRAEALRGCILLRSTPLHERQSSAAA